MNQCYVKLMSSSERYIRIALVFILMIGLYHNASCSQPTNLISIEDLFQQANVRHREWTLQTMDPTQLEPYLVDDPQSYDLITDEEWLALRKRGYSPETISVEEAEYDIDVFFRTLREGYAGYYYFGGEQAFDAAESRIREQIQENNTINPDQFTDLLNTETAFVKDGHFSIGTISGVVHTMEEYDFSIEDGVGYVAVKSFAAGIPYGEEFLGSAELLKECDEIVLDLRGNHGGDDQYPYEWIYNLLGKYPETGSYVACRNSRFANYGKSHGWTLDGPRQGTFAPNNKRIYVLVDQDTCSSAESCVNWLISFENVLIVGENTGGVMLCGNIQTCYLPNSRICFRFGTRLAFVGAGESMEGIGFASDISEEDVPARLYKK